MPASPQLRGATLFQVVPFKPHRVALIQTKLAGLKDSVLDKTIETTRDRLAALGSTLAWERRTAHSECELAPVLAEALKAGAELVLIAGASAILDRRDVIPAAVTALGGTIEHFGMPVDPGNLLLMARVGAVPILGLPGCARSPKVNGFDWVLRRVLAGLPVGPEVIRRMGVGGLLTEIPSRPSPRVEAGGPPAGAAPRRPARCRAGARRRTIEPHGRAQQAADRRSTASQWSVTPWRRSWPPSSRRSSWSPAISTNKLKAALQGLPLNFVFNSEYASGLSTSLKRGLAAVPAECDGALVALGDMPRVSATDIERLVNAFNPVEGRSIIVPTRHGKRGNPVLWGRRFFSEMSDISGDVGARHLIGAYPEAVAEVEMESDGVLTDIDTPQALARLAASAKIEA